MELRCAAVPARKPRKIGQLSASEANSAPVVISLAAMLPSMRLPRPATIAASSGRKTIELDQRSPLSPFIWLMSSTAIVPRLRK